MKKNVVFYVLPIYIVLTNLLQILLLESKGSSFDTIFKVFVLFGLIFFSVIFSIRNNIQIKRNDILFFSISLLCSLIIFIFNLSRTGLTLSYFISNIYPLINIFIFIILFSNVNFSSNDFKNFLIFFVIYVLYMCVFNFYINFNSILNFSSIKRAYEFNFSSFYNNRNTFAFYLIFGVISNFILITYYKKNDLFYYVSLIFMLFNTLLTLSRTAILCIAIFMFFYVFKTFKFKNKIMILIIFLLSFIFLLNLPGVFNFINNYVFRASSGLSGRGDVWSFGKSLIRNNELFGLGYSYPIMLLSNSRYNLTSFHNTFLTIFIYGGIVLSLFFLYVYYYCFDNILCLKKYNKNIYSVFICIFIIYFIYGLTETQILFFSSSVNFVSTCFVCLLPKYILNYYRRCDVSYEEK